MKTGRLSANKMHQTILYCRWLLPMSEHETPLIDGQYMLTRMNDRSPVERIHLVHWIRRRLSDTIEGLLMRPCRVTAEDISLLHRCAEMIHDFDEDPDMLYVVTRLQVRSHYTRHELERIYKAIEYDEAIEKAEASRWLWGAVEPGSINSPLRSSKSCSGCSNNAEMEFATASAVVVHSSPSSPLSDESASVPTVDETHSYTLSHIVPMNMEVRRSTLGRRAVDIQAAATHSFESLLIDSTKFHSPSVRIGGTRVSAKKVIATMLGSPTIVGRAPLQEIFPGLPRQKVVMTRRLCRSGNIPKQQSVAMLVGLKDAPSRVYANEYNENHCTNVPDHVCDTGSPVSPELINIPEASAEKPIAISNQSDSKYRDCSDSHRRWSEGMASLRNTKGCWKVTLLALLYSSCCVIILVVIVWFPRTITHHPESKYAASLQPLVIGSEPFSVLLSAAVMVMDDDSHPARVGSTTAAVSDDPRCSMLSIRDEHTSSVSSPICNQEDDTLFDDDMEADRGMRDRAITQRESIPIEREVSIGAEVGAAVVEWIPRKDEMERREHSTRIVLLRAIRRAVGWLQTGLWTGPLCLLRTIGRRLLTMI